MQFNNDKTKKNLYFLDENLLMKKKEIVMQSDIIAVKLAKFTPPETPLNLVHIPLIRKD